jgi:hypothetical protein
MLNIRAANAASGQRQSRRFSGAGCKDNIRALRAQCRGNLLAGCFHYSARLTPFSMHRRWVSRKRHGVHHSLARLFAQRCTGVII